MIPKIIYVVSQFLDGLKGLVTVNVFQHGKQKDYWSIKLLTTSNNTLFPALRYISAKKRVNFDGSRLKQHKHTYNHKTVVNIYTVYQINFLPFKQSRDFTLTISDKLEQFS